MDPIQNALLPLHYCHPGQLEPGREETLQDLQSFQNMARLGVDLFQINGTATADVYSGSESWISAGEYDYTRMEEGWRRIMDLHPEAKLCLRFFVGSPRWWDEAHPEELQAKEGGGTTFSIRHSDRTTVPSLASELWRKESQEAIVRFLQWLRESGWSERIWGFLVSAGITYEWGILGGAEFPDYSLPMQRRFRTYLKKIYGSLPELESSWGRSLPDWDRVAIPGVEDRKRATGDLREFPRDRPAYDYQRCLSVVTAESLLEVAKTLHDEGEEHYQVGAFYGYTLTAREGEGPSVSAGAGGLAGGHHALGGVLRSGLIDFIASPYAYADRDLGSGTLIPHFPWSSVLHHGRKIYLENDLWTFTNPRIEGNALSVGNTESREESILHQRLAIGTALCRGESLWWFDLTHSQKLGREVSNYSDPALCKELKRLRSLFRRLEGKRGRGAAQIALVIDEAAVDALSLSSKRFLREVYTKFSALAWSGAPFDAWLAEDVTEETMEPYRMVLLFAPMIEGGLGDRLRGVFSQGEKTVWVAPGTDIEGDWGTATVVERSWEDLDAEKVGEAALAAGVHLYGDAPLQVWATENLVLVHAKDAGEYPLKFPAGGTWKECFSGEPFRNPAHIEACGVYLYERITSGA